MLINQARIANTVSLSVSGLLRMPATLLVHAVRELRNRLHGTSVDMSALRSNHHQ